MKKNICLLGFALFFSATVAKAAMPEKEYIKYLQEQTKIAGPTAPVVPLSAEMKTKFAKQVKMSENKRRPANALSTKALSKEYTEFLNSWLAVKSADALEALLVSALKNYKNQPNDLKYVLTQVAPLYSFRGVLWKMIPLIKDNTVLHSYSLSFARTTIASMRIYLPGGHTNAVIQYFTEPYIRNGQIPEQFKTVAAFQSFFANDVYRALYDSEQKLMQLDLSTPIVWDNRFIYGEKSFPDAIEQFRNVGEAERLSSLSLIEGLMAEIKFYRAYNINQSIEMTADMGKLYGFDGIFSGKVNGAPMEDRVKVIKSSKYASFLTILPDGDSHLADSLVLLQNSAHHAQLAWEAIRSRPADEADLINTGWLQASTRSTDAKVKTLVAIVSGETKVRSAITGETVQVNVPAFYNSATRPKDLKVFLPSSFAAPMPSEKTLMFSDGTIKKVPYRDYDKGRATGWGNISQLKPYFPEITSSADFQRSVRILSEGHGTFPALSPLTTLF